MFSGQCEILEVYIFPQLYPRFGVLTELEIKRLCCSTNLRKTVMYGILSITLKPENFKTILLLFFILMMVMTMRIFLGHYQCHHSDFSPGFALRNYSWWYSGDFLGYWRFWAMCKAIVLPIVLYLQPLFFVLMDIWGILHWSNQDDIRLKAFGDNGLTEFQYFSTLQS